MRLGKREEPEESQLWFQKRPPEGSLLGVFPTVLDCMLHPAWGAFTCPQVFVSLLLKNKIKPVLVSSMGLAHRPYAHVLVTG